jgi:hypothetical protein
MFNQRSVSFSITYREKVRECISLLLNQLDGKNEHAPWSLMSNLSASRNIDALTREFYEMIFLPVYDYFIEKIEESIDLKNTKNVDLAEVKSKEIFVSYSNSDKDLAGKITSLLRANGFDTFLAHENIEISDVWRTEIERHLILVEGY